MHYCQNDPHSNTRGYGIGWLRCKKGEYIGAMRVVLNWELLSPLSTYGQNTFCMQYIPIE